MQIPLLPKGYYEIEVIKDNQRIFHKKDESHSWVRNAWNIFTSEFLSVNASDSSFGSGYLSAKDITGTVYYRTDQLFRNSNYNVAIDYKGAENSTNAGIVVGTSSTSENFDDYKLGSIILSGTTSGRLYYSAVSISASWDNTAKQWTTTISRNFNNATTSSIYVAEIGIYTYTYYYGEKTFMVCRDVVSPSIEVPASALLTVKYYLITQFPE